MHENIFEIEIITFGWNIDFLDPYPSSDIDYSRRFLCQSYEDATDKIKNLAAADKRGEIYRFVLRQLPLKEEIYQGDFINLWVYDNKGGLLDWSLCADCPWFDKENQFHGRPEKNIRFRKGEIVEWFDRDRLHIGIVIGIPPTPEECQIIEERIKKGQTKLSEWFMDYTDDCYTVIDGPDFMASHEHVFSPFVSKPSFFVRGKLRDMLNDGYNKYIHDYN